MLCISARWRMLEYHEGNLDRPARERLERHLSGCRGCYEYLQALAGDLERIRRAVGEAPQPPPADRVWERIQERLPDRARPCISVVRARTAVAALVVLVAAAGGVLSAWLMRGTESAPNGWPALVAPKERHASRLRKWWVDGVQADAGVVVLAGQDGTDVRVGDVFRIFASGEDAKPGAARPWWCDVVVERVRPGRLICKPKPVKGRSASELLSGMKRGWQAVKLVQPR
ncbi:MAG: anti-sigma factor family protein [Armatimonadota bacterium]